MLGIRRQKADPRDAHTASYEKFAWQDALALAAWLKRSFETESGDFIKELLAKPVAQRPACLRKISKNVDEMTQAIVVVLAINAQVRVMEVIEIRDRFRYALYPGVRTGPLAPASTHSITR